MELTAKTVPNPADVRAVWTYPVATAYWSLVFIWATAAALCYAVGVAVVEFSSVVMCYSST